MQTLAYVVVAASALWLLVVAIFMALRPGYCLHFLSLMASNWRINLSEQGLRLLAGLALVVRSPSSKVPWLFEVGGWFIVATSILLIILPLRWHAAYGAFWYRRLTPRVVRFLAPVSALMGMGLIYIAS